MRRPENGASDDDGASWGSMVAWFSEMVIRLDKGDLAGAVEAQARIEEHGFKITFRRRTRARKAVRP